MIAAIYARKSNAQDVADDQRSVARQVEHARQFTARKGWAIDEAYIFVDDDVSGATFDRPGFLRLLAALKPKAPFGALIVSEISRRAGGGRGGGVVRVHGCGGHSRRRHAVARRAPRP